MGRAPSTASLLSGCQCDVQLRSLDPILVVGIKAVLVPVFLLERKLGGRHFERQVKLV
jgi:hypothetical protein